MRKVSRKILFGIVAVTLLFGIALLLQLKSKESKSPGFELNSKSHSHEPNKDGDRGGCPGGTCEAIDPVNDPDYNLRNIAKQSILLEEHLAEDKKYCKACIAKHFLHIIGLAEEATWMAGAKLDDFPFLRKSVSFYTQTFDKWLTNKDDDGTKREVLDTLRAERRELIDTYFLKPNPVSK